MPLLILLLLLLWAVPAQAAITNPFVTIDGLTAPLTPMPCPSGYTDCYTVPMGTYGAFTVSSLSIGPSILFADGPYTDVLNLTGFALTGRAGSTAVLTYGGTYTQGAAGTYMYQIWPVGQFERPTSGTPITLQGSGCFTGTCLTKPFLTVTPLLIGGTQFSQRATGTQDCNVNGSCGNTLFNTLTVQFTEDNTVRMPGSLHEEVTWVQPVPEPASVWLLGTGLLLLSAFLIKPYFLRTAKLPQPVSTMWIGLSLVFCVAVGGLLLLIMLA